MESIRVCVKLPAVRWWWYKSCKRRSGVSKSQNYFNDIWSAKEHSLGIIVQALQNIDCMNHVCSISIPNETLTTCSWLFLLKSDEGLSLPMNANEK